MRELIKGKLREIIAVSQNPGVQRKDCRIRAHNDVEALERWLDEYFLRPATFRTYKREAERFLVWLSVARNSCLYTLHRDDVLAYLEFLKDPQPRAVMRSTPQ